MLWHKNKDILPNMLLIVYFWTNGCFAEAFIVTQDNNEDNQTEINK